MALKSKPLQMSLAIAAMAAGLTDRVWDMADVVAMIEQSEMLVPAAQAE